ncbi:MAG: DUF4350 domain-containing protein [Aquimonas sp.]|nr:DUF4350 domain-containing protein [Aquimonas sp.]
MSWRIPLTVFSLLLLAALGGWWHLTYELRSVEVPTALTGEARRNPLYGLREVLRAQGRDAETLAQLDIEALPGQGPRLLVLALDPRQLREREAQSLLQWVHSGGHLLARLPPSSEGRAPELLSSLGLALIDHESCIDWRSPQTQPASAIDALDEAAMEELMEDLGWRPHSTRFCSRVRMLPEDADDTFEWDFSYGNAEQGYVLARFRHGAGLVTLASQLDLLRTAALRSPEQQAAAHQLLAPSLADGVQIRMVFATPLPPLHVLLVQQGWPLLLPLLLALLAWLWARMQRFGPVLPERAIPRRALAEHLRAAGELAQRSGRSAALLAPLRRRAQASLQRSRPELAALEPAEQSQALARLLDLPPVRVYTALYSPRLDRSLDFVDAVRLLIRLSQRP